MSEALIYATKRLNTQDEVLSPEYTFKCWKPDFKNRVPPGKSKKYLVFWLFHLLAVFGNKYYRAVLVYEKNKLIASLIVAPAYFRWRFMNRKDLQFIYVMTNKEYRGKGLANRMMAFASESTPDFDGTWWYVTTRDNVASQRAAEKSGFVLQGTGVRRKDVFNSLELKRID